jgi:RNA polymerase sigma-70 factor (ECF subfamily)
MNSLNQEAAPLRLLAMARAGDRDALGKLLQVYRNYLHLLACAHLGADLRLRLNPSDLVQETFVDACADFAGFRGATEAELVVWLRKILVRNLADQARRHKAQARDARREESLEVLLDRSSMAIHKALAESASSPSAQAMRQERAVVLADKLAQLPEDYRQVLILRSLLHLKFDDVSVRMGRSSVAVRLLWMRALERLRGLLEVEP